METTRTFEVLGSESRIDWIGRKVTGAHNGTIGIKEGTLVIKENALVGGSFVIDTTSIRILDVTDPDTNAQFAGHLASDDFFSIDKFPTATLLMKTVSPKAAGVYQVEGDLTIKGITHPIVFEAALVVKDDIAHASAKLIIDRTLYGIRFRSGNFFKDLGDTLIYNDFELNVILTAKAR